MCGLKTAKKDITVEIFAVGNNYLTFVGNGDK
jgi:hypothetical protein